MGRSATNETFWALSDPVRIEILDRVAAGTEVTVTQLAEVLPMSRQAVSRHTKTLEDSGLLVGIKAGREFRYRVDLTSLDEAGKWLEARTSSWEDALHRLADYLARTGD
ncbi:MAG: metalloregulator ArsR/SmtB family transcription factor [Acidimicrobiia bacterium]|nr:metalloregulator ArsR/SmtB family transcription factor [Acidimicrobiia bacterium]